MPPIYELSSPFFYQSQRDRAELVKNVGGKIVDIDVDNGEAGMYFAVRRNCICWTVSLIIHFSIIGII